MEELHDDMLNLLNAMVSQNDDIMIYLSDRVISEFEHIDILREIGQILLV